MSETQDRAANRLRGGAFHDGELAVQRRAGVESEAARLSGMLARAELRGGMARFLAERTFAAITARDGAGRLWISPLAGAPGFLDATRADTLTVRAEPVPGDPLHGLAPGQQVGLLVVEFAARRRVRINGLLAAASVGGLEIEVEQAYGNCPQYIQPRRLRAAPTPAGALGAVRRGAELAAEDIEQIRAADTFLIGTAHPTRGSDASHRGGPAGFVRVDGGRIWWPDYAGNNMFNTFGNLDADPAAALLFADFATGRTVQLSGTAAVQWTDRGIPGDDGGTGRRVSFAPEAVVAGTLLTVREGG